MDRYGSLSERQVQVLQWIDDGCPDGTWSDFSYKTTTYALASRGLVTVDRCRDYWSATTTEKGEFYLAHNCYPAAAETDQTSPVGSSDDIGELASQLLEDLMAGDRKLVIQDPNQPQRSRYRRAIHRLITAHRIPDGFGLRHSGRDRGDLTIRLTALPDDSKQSDPPPRVPVPNTLEDVNPSVRSLGGRGRLAVTPGAVDRALRIAQAIANECATRGWAFEPSHDDGRGFRILASECTFNFTLTEELIDREIQDNQSLQAAKYPWQRVPLKVVKVGSGRLTLLLEEPFKRRSWSDRSRWSLDDKLGAVFVELETRVADAKEKRRRREEELLRQQEEWDAAVPAAKRAYIAALNRRRLREQVTQYREADTLRKFAEVLEQTAHQADSKTGESIRQWAAWARSEADRVDPLTDISALVYLEPDEIGPADFDKFMPAGMSAYRRPTT